MIHIFKEIRILRDEGKLHSKLLTRIRILFFISFLLLCVVIFNLLTKHVNILLAGALGIVGFVLGFFVFSKMNVVNWNEEEEVLKSGKMDILGFASLLLYILFEVGFRTFLKDYFPESAVPLLLAGICGTILGRAIGTLFEMHKVYRLHHK
jgi:hypothetical protein